VFALPRSQSEFTEQWHGNFIVLREPVVGSISVVLWINFVVL